MKIVIDLDGTIFDLLTPWLQRLNRAYNTDFKTSDVLSYNVAQSLGISQDRALGALRMHPELYSCLEPYPNAVAMVKMLMVDHEVVLASRCSGIPMAYSHKLSSVKQHFGDGVDLVVCDDKRSISHDMLIDDCPMYHTGGKMNVLSYTQPYQPNGMSWIEIYRTIVGRADRWGQIK